MTHSNHPDRSQIIAYVACDLSAEIASEVETHLEGCDQCMELLIDAVDRGIGPKWLEERLDALAADGQQFQQWAEDSSTARTIADGRGSNHTFAGVPGLSGQMAAEPDASEGDELSSDRAGPAEAFRRQRTDQGWLDELSAIEPPSELGRYRVGRKLGQGGMGAVFEATDQVTGRPVAMKFVQGVGLEGNCRNRVLNEARAMARLSHHHIVSVLDVLTYDDQPVLVIERVDGVSLDRWQAKRMICSRWAAELVRKLALAIHHAHDQGVVHRDLKPSNVLLVGGHSQRPDTTPLPSLEPKVTDFGISRILDQLTQQTRAGELLGTPAYMAPEMIEGQTETDISDSDFEPELRRSSPKYSSAIDIYGLGVILYELLTGRPPFTSTDPVITLALVRDADPITPRALRPELPVDIETICLKCLEKQPGRRYGSALALATDLAAFLEDRPVHARPLGPLGRMARWSRRNRVGVAAVVTLLTASIGSVAFAMSQRGDRGEADRLITLANFSILHATEKEQRAQDAWRQFFNSYGVILDVLDPVGDHANEESLTRLRETEAREMIVRRVGEHWSQAAIAVSMNLADIQSLHRILSLESRLNKLVLSEETAHLLLARVKPHLDRLERESPDSVPVLKLQMGFLEWQYLRHTLQGNWECVYELLLGTTPLVRRLLELVPDNEELLHAGIQTQHNLAMAAHRLGREETGRAATSYLLELHRKLNQDWASDGRMRLALVDRLLDVVRFFNPLIGHAASQGLLIEARQMLDEPLPDELANEQQDALRRVDQQFQRLDELLGEYPE